MTITIRKEYYHGGELYKETYMDGRVEHRDDGPAITVYNTDGTIDSESYVYNGYYHRDGDLPARIMYHDNGKICHEEYYIHGKRHRVGKPATIQYNDDGSLYCEMYYITEALHNTFGPAIINYNNKYMEYHVNGKRLTENTFNKKYRPHLYVKKVQTFTINGKKYIVDKELSDSTIILKLVT